MDVGEDADDSNRGMLLFIHYLESEVDKQFRENFKDEIGLKVLGGVSHDHRESLLE
jgi:hypothetical protein